MIEPWPEHWSAGELFPVVWGLVCGLLEEMQEICYCYCCQ